MEKDTNTLVGVGQLGVSTSWRHLRDWCRTLLVTARQFIDDRNLSVSVSALTFSSMMASVPLVAMLFALSNGFGAGSLIENWVRDAFSSQPQVADAIITFTHNYLQHTENTYIVGVGIVVILYSLFFLMKNIEETFNYIWHAERRSWAGMVSNYTAIFIFFIIFISFSFVVTLGANTIGQGAADILGLDFIAQHMPRVAPILSLSTFFFFIYTYIPNTYVRWQSAIVPSLVAGCCMNALQQLYVYCQLALASYNIIYGSFAALPLFLIWLECSWYICLTGVVMVHAHQNLSFVGNDLDANALCHDQRLILCADVIHQVAAAFEEGKPALTAADLQRQLGLPQHLVNSLLDLLVQTHLLTRIPGKKRGLVEHTTTYLPSLSPSAITYGVLLDRLNQSGCHLNLDALNDHLKPLHHQLQKAQHKLIADAKNCTL